MSIEARQRLVNSPSTFFQNQSQKADFLNPNIVRTETIALVLELLEKGHILEFTAVRSDHHDDSHLGRYCHAHGAAVDLWPLKSHHPGDYADAVGPQMTSLVRDIMASKWTAQCGLAGSADCDELRAAAGYVTYPEDARLFADDGGDHIHIGCHFPGGIA